MKNLFLPIVLAFWSAIAFGQNGTVTGFVLDEDGARLEAATIQAEGTTSGTFSDADGSYTLNVPAGTYRILCSYVGYASQSKEVTVQAGRTITLNFSLATEALIGAEIVVSGSKKREKLTESPATIETIYAREIAEYAGNPAELLARQKGIDYFRAGIATPAFNIRGFNSNFNSKNLQVTDGRYSTLIATGLPLGPLNTTVKEDIEQVEVILGPNATLYGPNAHNGLLNIITKDPRTSAGTTFGLSGGATGDGDPYYSFRARHAQVVSDQFAFKVVGEYTAGTEFEYSDSVFVDRRDKDGNLIGSAEYQGADGVKEGWPELELDPDVDFTRLEAGLYFTPATDFDIIVNGGYSNSNYLSPTNVGRNQIKDWQVYYGQLRLDYKNFFAQFYYTGSQTDSTYAIDERTKRYYTGIDLLGMSDADARGDFSYSSGALFQDDSKRLNAEIQYNETFGGLELIAGGQWQRDMANSLGSYLIEQDENDFYDGTNIVVNQYGGYLHLTYNFGRGWKALAASRFDYHDVYEFNFVPKLGLLKIADWGTVRLTYGQGIASPTILNMFGKLFGGLILGNAEGFVLQDGSMREKQTVEKLQTFELGYRGQVIKNKLFLDANAYYNISKDFLSPLATIGFVDTWGTDVPVEALQSDVIFGAFGGLVLSYVNFGQVNTYGFDLGATYYFTPALSGTLNYSYFDWSVDENDLENDFDGNGTVNFLDVLVNAPTHKLGVGLNYSGEGKFYGGIFGRWVQAYDYFSSFQIASKSYPFPEYSWRGFPITEGARSADTFNYGPLGGFFTVDLNLGYRINDIFTVGVAAVNLTNQELREFTASAPTRGLYTLEVLVNLPAIGSK